MNKKSAVLLGENAEEGDLLSIWEILVVLIYFGLLLLECHPRVMLVEVRIAFFYFWLTLSWCLCPHLSRKLHSCI